MISVWLRRLSSTNDDRIKCLEVTIFVKVVQLGSFIGASRALDMPKATVREMKIIPLQTIPEAQLF
jgi:hypothetical protein